METNITEFHGNKVFVISEQGREDVKFGLKRAKMILAAMPELVAFMEAAQTGDEKIETGKGSDAFTLTRDDVQYILEVTDQVESFVMDYSPSPAASGSSSDLISEIKIHKFNSDGNLKAFASLTFKGIFLVTGLKVMNGKNGLFVAMPSRKTEQGEYKDIAFPLTKEFRSEIQSRVLAEYEKNS